MTNSLGAVSRSLEPGKLVLDESSVMTKMEVTDGFGVAIAKGPSLGIRSWPSPPS